MLYSDAALYRVQRWLEDLDPTRKSAATVAEMTGLSWGTIRRLMLSGGRANLTLETLRRLERQIPPDFMPLRLHAAINDDPADAA